MDLGKYIFIATDGGALANGKPQCKASWAYVMVPGNEIESICEGQEWNSYEASGRVEGAQSNNRGELEAILRALMKADEELIGGPYREIWIISDSAYSIKSIDIWSRNWEGRQMANMELIYAAQGIIDRWRTEGLKVVLAHIRGHQTAPSPIDGLPKDLWAPIWRMNRRADALCTSCLEAAK